MRDDWNDRRQSSNDYLNRVEDRIYAHDTQTANARAVFDANRTHDDLKARLALGINAYDPAAASESDVDSRSTEELIVDSLADLRRHLQFSDFLPSSFRSAWLLKLAAIDVNKQLPAFDAIVALSEAWERAMERAAPRRDIFNLAIDEEMRFMDECNETRRTLRLLRAAFPRLLGERIASAMTSRLKLG